MNEPNTQSEAIFAQMVEAAPAALILINKGGDIVYANAQAEKLFGYSRSELTGQAIEILIPVRFTSAHPGLRNAFFISPQARSMGSGRELFAMHKDGTEFPVEIGLNPLVTDDADQVLALVIDISQRKKSEAQQDLSASIIDSSDDAILSKDLNGMITSWNRGAEHIFGYTSDEAIGQHITMLIPLHLQEEETLIMAKIRAGKTIDHYETERVAKNGTTICVSITVSPVKDIFGRITGASKIARDITARKKAEQELLKAKRLFAFLSAINQSIVHSADEASLLASVCRIAIDTGKFESARIGRHDGNNRLIMADEQVTRPMPSGLQKYSGMDFSLPPLCNTPSGKVLKTGKHALSNNAQEDPDLTPWSEQMRQANLHSCASFPIKKFGALWGVFTLFSSKKDFFDELEINLLNEAAGDISFALENFEKEHLRKEAEEERNRAREAIAASEAFSRNILASLSSHIAVIAEDGEIIATNRAWEDFARENGASIMKSTGVGSNYFEVCRKAVKHNEPYAAEAMEGIQSVLRKEKKSFELRYPCHSPDEERWFLLRVNEFAGDKPKVITAHENITNIVKAEQEITKSELKYRHLFQSNPMPMWVIDAHTYKFLSVNDTAIRHYGYSREEFLSMTAAEIRPAEDVPKLLGLRYTDDLAPRSVGIWKHKVKSGALIDVEIHSVGMIVDGQVARLVLVTDVTEKMKSEREKKEAEEILRKSKANLNAIMENTDAFIYSIDTDYRYLTFNSALKKSLKEVYGLDIQPGDLVFDFLNKLDPAEASQWQNIYTEALSGKPIHFVKEFNVHDFRSFLSFSVNPIWESGQVIGLSCFATDITQQKLAEAEIISLNESLEAKVKERTTELQAANRELETFSYTVSHDLQSPLRILSGFSGILLHDYKDKLDDPGKEFLNVINSSAVRMSELIRDLLQFSKLGKSNMQKETVSMHDLAAAAVNEVKLGQQNFKTEITLLPLKDALCDKVLIMQVWANLIANAVKYSSKKENPRVEIGMQESNGEAVYYIKDNGAGFDMKYVHKLFGVFQRMHDAADFEGTGVGLATVHRIITRHSGRIWAEGKVDEGATFYFTLP